MWPMLAAMAAGALMGKMKGDADRKNAEAMNNAAAEQTRYSWATGGPMGQLQAVPSAWGSMLQGGMSGAMIGSGLENMGASAGADAGANAAASAAPAASAGTNALGGSNMAQQLGAQGDAFQASMAKDMAKPSLYAGADKGFADFAKPNKFSVWPQMTMYKYNE